MAKTASYSAALADNGTLSFSSSGAVTLTLVGAGLNPLPVGHEILDPAGHIQRVTVGGTTAGSIPTFNDTGGTTTDGGVLGVDGSRPVFQVDTREYRTSDPACSRYRRTAF